MKADTHLHGVHEGLVEGVVQVRDDWAEWVDVAGVDQLLWPTQLDWMDESPHQVARGEDPLDDDQHLGVDLKQPVARPLCGRRPVRLWDPGAPGCSQVVLRSDLVPQVHAGHPRVAKVPLGHQFQPLDPQIHE